MLVPVRMRRILIAAPLLASCSPLPPAVAPSTTPDPSASPATPIATRAPGPATEPPASTANLTPCERDLRCSLILSHVEAINPYKLDDHLNALTSFVSRDPRHPGHAKAVAYIKEQLNALAYYGWRIESQRTVYQGIPLENIFATLDPAPGTSTPSGSPQTPPPPGGSTGWVPVAAHSDPTAKPTAGRPAPHAPAPPAHDTA